MTDKAPCAPARLVEIQQLLQQVMRSLEKDGCLGWRDAVADLLAAEAYWREEAGRLHQEIAEAREACPSIRLQDHGDDSLLALVNREVSRGFNRDSEVARLAEKVYAAEVESEILLLRLKRVYEWRDAVTLALQREGGALYEDAPMHIREFKERAERAEAAAGILACKVEELATKLREMRQGEPDDALPTPPKSDA